MPDRMSDDRQWYEGTSEFLLWAPKVFLAMAVVMFLGRWSHWTQFATAFTLLAFIHSRWLPWRFEIQDDGLRLLFPFGRDLFLQAELHHRSRRRRRRNGLRRSPRTIAASAIR